MSTVRYAAAELIEFTARVLTSLGMPAEDARLAGTVLVDADLMGIDSHGIAHLPTHGSYAPAIREGRVNPRPVIRVVRETAATALLDGDGGMGVVVGHHAMRLAIAKARDAGCGSVAVRNSRHYGAAGYYAMMAVPEDMIGLSFTNAGPWTTPTNAKRKMIGTNPIAVAAPAGTEQPFLCDLATSTVAMGKLEIAARESKPIPAGWSLDGAGHPTEDIPTVYREGGLTPLGSTATTSSYKGYALGVMVDVFSGLLSGAGYSLALGGYGRDVGHFFAAWRIDAFRPAIEFKAMMDEMQRAFRTAEPADPARPVLLPGQREFACRAERERNGIPLHVSVVSTLDALAYDVGVAPARPLDSVHA
ncbi:MAG: Ldh family oxidoreductase [Dehalococcoidia bacterium]